MANIDDDVPANGIHENTSMTARPSSFALSTLHLLASRANLPHLPDFPSASLWVIPRHVPNSCEWIWWSNRIRKQQSVYQLINRQPQEYLHAKSLRRARTTSSAQNAKGMLVLSRLPDSCFRKQKPKCVDCQCVIAPIASFTWKNIAAAAAAADDDDDDGGGGAYNHS
ncbi:hypothetical protein EGR_07448 [Echinococcus granulosus]|uniref:Uncharacterized protein n=1 Tax=Echinococcus granulosus TaxID=6210 RepID=W6UHY2_ECHGR|nr:hypothetical protein EGR_07448 [Echinococcus granulosus]EUB57707.1 hypothetical protein EGR_07448 [Echinococcus granulosus]